MENATKKLVKTIRREAEAFLKASGFVKVNGEWISADDHKGDQKQWSPTRAKEKIMAKSTADFIRSQPKPTEEEALDFARSVMTSKGVDVDWGPYEFRDGLSITNARDALEKHCVDTSEAMALEKIEYALEA